MLSNYSVRDSSDLADCTLRLDPNEFPEGHGFFRAFGETSGEKPLAIWTFRENSLSPVTLSSLATPLDATFMSANSSNNGNTYALGEEGFGIDTVTIFGRESP